jgi:uncharacterized membrane protein YgcG
MKRVVGTVIGLAVLLAILFIPAAFWNSGDGDSTYEETSITTYVADFTVDEDGGLDVVENITVNFPYGGKHGIFRFFDRADPSAPHARRIVEDVEVAMDGSPENFEMIKEDHERFDVAKIGSASVFVDPGEHLYTISYHIDGVVEPGTEGQESQFYWNLIPSGWQQTIDSSTLTVHLPTEAVDTQCAQGVGETGGCTATGDGTKTLVVKTGPLDAHTPVTIKTGLDMPTPDEGHSLPWTARFDRVLGGSLWLLVVVLVLAALAGLWGAVLGKRSREKDPQFPLMYGPPEGIGPAQGKYILTESIGKTDYVATLMYAAEHGAVDLDKTEDSWTIRDKNGAQGWAGLDPVTSSVAHILGGPGTAFTASKKSVEAGKRLRDEIADFETNTKSWALTSGNLVASGLGGFGGLLVLVCWALPLVAVIWNPFSMTMVGIIPGAFAVCGSSLMATGSGTKRTPAGRDLWSKVGGFKRILATDSAEQRFDFSGRKELYTAFIPWAVAFECADEWAKKYKVETGEEPPVPHYFASSYAGASAASYVDSMVDDFGSTVDSAISAYNATQSSSSSGGGGGFSGGGGGGGGGGGSW